jgi:hypothetical protein
MGQARSLLSCSRANPRASIAAVLLISALAACGDEHALERDASNVTPGAPNVLDAGLAPPVASAMDAAGGAPARDASQPPDAGAALDANTSPTGDAALGDGGVVAADAGPSDAGQAADGGTALMPIPAPVPDDCITKVSAGDHVFTCSGVTFLVKIDEQCTKTACGLIFDVHGGTMGGLQMRDNTKLHELAPQHGYIVVHPSATPENTGGSWDLTADPPKIVDFFQRMAKAFHTDAKRHHVTGFSQGSAVTFYFLCKHSNLLASAAPISGNSADTTCINSMWQPRVPFLFMSGTKDTALTIETSNMRIETMISQLGLMGGTQIEGDGHYTRKRWTGAGGMELDYLVHDYGGQFALDGHCIPGGTDIPGGPNSLPFGVNATTCTTGDIKIKWGELALKYFLEHPKR